MLEVNHVRSDLLEHFAKGGSGSRLMVAVPEPCVPEAVRHPPNGKPSESVLRHRKLRRPAFVRVAGSRGPRQNRHLVAALLHLAGKAERV